jgi:putative copper export protein
MVAADTLHVFAAGSWIGGLLLVLYLEVRSRSSAGEGGSLLPDLVPAFSPLAVASVVVMIVTGTLASWVHVGSFTTLFTTRYGRLLSLKLLLVAIVMVLGANNWKRLTPKLGDPGGPRAMRRAAVTEVILAQAVLLLTAILVRMSPM